MDSLFPDNAPAGADDLALVAAYGFVGRTLDDLPYTDDFDRLADAYKRSFASRPCPLKTHAEILHRLQGLRKAGKLPRLGRAASPPPVITPEHEALLRALILESLGSTGRRDSLPYTPQFDHLLHLFNHRAALSLAPHDLWRLIARLTKSSTDPEHAPPDARA
ncbi:MAG: hypothetical protein HRU70_15080 [Phycisphaeraceae bacterium]|nr:MAG: hypothetical protein HRU70_15080 [Phycisphaeraceae bacterium]